VLLLAILYFTHSSDSWPAKAAYLNVHDGTTEKVRVDLQFIESTCPIRRPAAPASALEILQHTLPQEPLDRKLEPPVLNHLIAFAVHLISGHDILRQPNSNLNPFDHLARNAAIPATSAYLRP